MGDTNTTDPDARIGEINHNLRHRGSKEVALLRNYNTDPHSIQKLPKIVTNFRTLWNQGKLGGALNPHTGIIKKKKRSKNKDMNDDSDGSSTDGDKKRLDYWNYPSFGTFDYIFNKKCAGCKVEYKKTQRSKKNAYKQAGYVPKLKTGKLGTYEVGLNSYSPTQHPNIKHDNLILTIDKKSNTFFSYGYILFI